MSNPKQFVPQILQEPFQLTKKDKCKYVTIDYYELYIAVIDHTNKLQVFALNTLALLYSLDLSSQYNYSAAFGNKSQQIAIYSDKEIFFYNLLQELELQSTLQFENLIKFDYFTRNDHIILTQTNLMNNTIQIEINDPITFLIINQQKANDYDLLILLQESIQLFKNLELLDTLNFKSSSKTKLKYDDQDELFSIFDQNIISIFYISKQKIQHKKTIPLNVEKIHDGCYFQLPYYKQTEFFGHQMFICMVMTKGKLGSQFAYIDIDTDYRCIGPPFQEKKCKNIIPIKKWGNNLLVLFEQGCMNRIQLYKFNQFQKLDHKFHYFPKNELYVEQEDEFDRKIRKKNLTLDITKFQKQFQDSYYSYIK